MLTGYDYSMAGMIDQAGIDMILVGDSRGMSCWVILPLLPVTMDDMVHHTKAVSRAAQNAMVAADMPFLSYHISITEAVPMRDALYRKEAPRRLKSKEGSKGSTPLKPSWMRRSRCRDILG